MLRRELLDGAVRGLSGMGFKILLDLIASAKVPIAIAEVPYTFRTRFAGQSKLDTAAVWEFAMLLADKLVGRYVPVRFVAFAIVGGAGVLVHMAVMAALLSSGLEFTTSQTAATLSAMVFNYSVNNELTYRDRRRRGRRWVTGLLSFIAACSVGALANIGIASYLFGHHRARWFVAALAGILVGAVWNYAVTTLYTWGKPRE